ncbi:MAG: hypothetical protein R3D00_17065 [Bacteroidia bacterium]
MKKIILLKSTFPIFVFLMALSPLIYSQSDPILSAKKLVYDGYLTGEAALWDKGIRQLEIIANQGGTRSFSSKYELAVALYGNIGFEMSKKDEKSADIIAEKTVELLENLQETHASSAEVHAILGSAYAMKIALSPAKALLLGPKSSSQLEKAIVLDPESPVAWCEMGNMRLHAPRLFGGSVKESIECFSKAIRLFEKQGSRYSWQYLHAMVWLGKAYEENGEWEKAYAAYLYALQKEPSLRWVKDELLPQAKLKLGN